MATGTAISLTIGAALGAGWIKTFSDATKSSNVLGSAISTLNKKIKGTNDATEKATLQSYTGALHALSRQVAQTSQSLSSFFSIIKNAFFATSSLISSTIGATGAVASYGAELARTAERLGMFDKEGTANVEMLQKMQYVALQADISAENLSKYLDDMTRRIAAAKAGSGEAASALQKLGLSASALSNMGADKQFELIVKSLERVENRVDRTRMIGQLFGEEASRTLPNLVARGWTQIAADINTAGEHIVHGNKRIVSSSLAWETEMKKLRTTASGLFYNGLMSFLPTVADAFNRISSALTTNKEKIGAAMETFSSMAKTLVPVLTEILTKSISFSASIASIKPIVFSVAAAFSALGIAITTVKTITLATNVAFLIQKGILATRALLISAEITLLNAWQVAIKITAVATNAWALVCKGATAIQSAFNTTIASSISWLGAHALVLGKNAAAWTFSTAKTIAQVAALGVLKTATLAWTAITKTATAAQWALNVALSANPIGIVIAAVAALAAGFVWLWNNCDTFREGVLAVCTAVGNAFTWLWDSLSSGAGAAWEFVSSAASSAWSAITNGAAAAWTKLKDICGKIIDIFKKVMEFSPIGLAIKAGSAIADFFSDENVSLPSIPPVAAPLATETQPATQPARSPFTAVIDAFDARLVPTPAPLATETQPATQPARSPFTAVVDAFDARLAPTPAPQQIPLGEITAPLASPASPARGNTQRGNVITDNSTQNFTIVQQPGEDAESLAQRIAKIIAGDYASAAAAMI